MTVEPFPRPRVPRWLTVTLIVVFGLLTFGRTVATFYTDALWFDQLGYGTVFWTGISTRVILWAIFGVLATLIFFVNLWLTIRATPDNPLFSPDDPIARARHAARPYALKLAAVVSLVGGFLAGGVMSLSWRSWLLFRNGVDVGQTDEVFNRDIGFYLFSLPFQNTFAAWLFGVLIFAVLMSVVAYLLLGGIRPEAPLGQRVPGAVRAHLSVVVGLIILVRALLYRLEQFGLLFSPRGQVTGASYTDVNAELPALKLLVLISIVCAVLFFINARVRNWALPVGGVALLVLAAVIAGGAYPALVQRFRVTPNERERERLYIERNIAATRQAYGLDEVKLQPFPASGPVTTAAAANNRSTLENVRLWDPRVLDDTYLNLQRIKQYYEFLDVDVDRYEIEGELRQVMLSAREVDVRALDADARTWLNEHLVYTHGYGIVASRVDRVTREGQPSFVLRDIPTESLQGAPEVTQPRIYFGENTDTYVVVGGAQNELDFPQGDGFAENRYEGKGGVAFGSLLRRLAFAWRFGDVNLLISGAITGDSEILMKRSLTERISESLPFITPDTDPYIAVLDGRLVWIVDGYTTSDMWPYSERVDFNLLSRRLSGNGNYIRNAVKIAVDAEDGTVIPYVWDESDPILQSWMKVFPDLVRPKSEMPDAMLEHVRYPEGLFDVQTAVYTTYHITDADNFYSKEDAWRIANDPTSPGDGVGGAPAVPAYYMLMKLPGEEDLSFVLVRPFTPNGRPNLTGYMVAKGDVEEYGELITYQLPKSEQVFGPQQVQARINNDPVIAPQLTLLDQRGSKVIRGNILIVPIEKSLLYVQPIYVEGQGSNLPELKMVVVVTGDTVKAGPTLNAALQAVFGDKGAGSSGSGSGSAEPPPSRDVVALIEQALEAEAAAQTALRNGDFAEYGRQQERSRELMEQAAQAARNNNG
ncbi:MAG: UPF0182 family protein [Actinomycetota bacterium]